MMHHINIRDHPNFFKFVRPPLARVAIAVTYLIATIGLLILAFATSVLVDKWAVVGAAIGTLICLGGILLHGYGVLWLGVSASWIYALVIEMARNNDSNEASGLGLIFLALSVGALSAYSVYRWELRERNH